MHAEAPHQLHHRLAAEGRRLFGRVESFLGQTFGNLHRAISCLRYSPDTLTQPRVVAQVLDPAHGAGDHPRGAPTPEPFNRDLEAFAPAFTGYDHSLDDLADDLFALCHRRRRGMPEGWHIVRKVHDSLPLCR